jgi:hypothetical protein
MSLSAGIGRDSCVFDIEGDEPEPLPSLVSLRIQGVDDHSPESGLVIQLYGGGQDVFEGGTPQENSDWRCLFESEILRHLSLSR